MSHSKFHRALEHFSPGAMVALRANLASQVPVNAEKAWIGRLYMDFCSKLEVEALPVTPNTLSDFVTFAVMEADYSLSTVRATMVPYIKGLSR